MKTYRENGHTVVYECSCGELQNAAQSDTTGMLQKQVNYALSMMSAYGGGIFGEDKDTVNVGTLRAIMESFAGVISFMINDGEIIVLAEKKRACDERHPA